MKRVIVSLLVLVSFCAGVFAQGPVVLPAAASAPVVSADPFADVGGLPMSQAEMEATEGEFFFLPVIVAAIVSAATSAAASTATQLILTGKVDVIDVAISAGLGAVSGGALGLVKNGAYALGTATVKTIATSAASGTAIGAGKELLKQGTRELAKGGGR